MRRGVGGRRRGRGHCLRGRRGIRRWWRGREGGRWLPGGVERQRALGTRVRRCAGRRRRWRAFVDALRHALLPQLRVASVRGRRRWQRWWRWRLKRRWLRDGTLPSAKRKAETSPRRLLRESRGVRLRSRAAAKTALRRRARTRARCALAGHLGLYLGLWMPEVPRDGAVGVEAERVHAQVRCERGGASDCSTRRPAQVPSRGGVARRARRREADRRRSHRVRTLWNFSQDSR